VINAQASRLAATGDFETKSLTLLRAEDLESPAQAFLEEYTKKRKGYLVKCPHCDHAYSWTPDLEIVEAVCHRCGKHYNCEFGMIQT
jgi:acetyl-CoA carboxylase beta subunit